jgi:hypothetical protein
MNFYYPDNMEAPAMLLLWKLRDIPIIFFSAILMFMLSLRVGSIAPLVPVALYAVMTITFPNGSIFSYIVVMGRFLVSQQRIYFWK